jgi:transposase
VFDAAIGRAERIENASAPIAALAERWRGREVFVLFEATGRYDQMLRSALEAAQIRFTRVNPQRARAFARAAGFLAKTDAVDARMLALMAERLRPAPDVPRQDACERLNPLHRRRDQLVHMRVQERTRLSETGEGQEHRDILRHIDWLSGEIKAIEARIAAFIAAVPVLAEHARRLRTAPGIGPPQRHHPPGPLARAGHPIAQDHRRSCRTGAPQPRQRRDARQAHHRRRAKARP